MTRKKIMNEKLESLYVKIVPFRVRCFLEKVFRKDHISDFEIWELGFHITQYVYPRLVKFRALPRMGIPTQFCSSPEELHMEKDKFDELVAKGEIIPGGEKKWNEILDKMIMAFEFDYKDVLFVEKELKPFCKKWGYEYKPFDEFIKSDEYQRLYNDVQEGFKLFGQHFQSLWD
jgi:hypothetical protein